jgi:hypothetical protein
MNGITSTRVKARLNDMVSLLGQYAAVGYAQRCVGMRETGTLTSADVEQINASEPENFLLRFGNLCEFHVRQKQGTQEQKDDWLKRVRA